MSAQVSRAMKALTPTVSPTVSVVIPMFNVEDFLDASLASLRAQTHSALQIIVVDDGSTDGSAAICRRHAEEDSRIIMLHQHNAGQGSARNLGVRRASGRYLTFLDADDVLPVDAYATMVASLEASGSDFALGSVRRLTDQKLSSAPWIDLVHSRDRVGVALDDFPNAVMDVICCNRMLKRSFWTDAEISFPEGVAYEDHVPMMKAFVRAERFDVLRAVTYHWRIRDSQTSGGHRKRELANLRDRLAAKEQAAELLKDSSARVRDAWLRRVLAVDLPGFISQLEWADDAYWAVLGAAVRGFLSDAGDQVINELNVSRKLQAWLLAEGRRDQLTALLRWQRENPRGFPTQVQGGQVVARFPMDATSGDIPDSLLTLTEHETRLVAALRGAVITGAGVLELSGWAHPQLVDLSDREVLVEAALVEERYGLRYDLPVEPRDDPDADRVARHPYQSYRRSGFLARVDLDELIARTPDSEPDDGRPGRLGTWRVELRCSVAGVIRTGPLRSRDAHSSAGELPSARVADGVGVVAVMRDGLCLEVRRPRALLSTLTLVNRTVQGSIRSTAGPAAQRSLLEIARGPVELRVQGGRRVLAASIAPRPSGELSFTVTLPELDEQAWGEASPDRRIWTVDVVQGRRSERLGWPVEEPGEWWPAEESREWWPGTPEAELPFPEPVEGRPSLAAQRTARGNVQLREINGVAVVEDVLLADDQVVVLGRWLGAVRDDWYPRLRLDGDADPLVWPASHVESTAEDGLGFRCVFDVGVDLRGRGLRPPPSGGYLLEFVTADGSILIPRMAAELVSRTAVRFPGRRCELRLQRGDRNQVSLQVSAPLEPEEASAYGQRVLRERYLTGGSEPVGTAILFQVGNGEDAGGDSLMRFHQLYDADVRTCFWAVTDLSRLVPDGALPLIVGSADWYSLLATAGTLVIAGGGVDFLRARPGQTVLWTGHIQ